MGDILNFIGSGVIPIFLIIIVVVLIVSYIGSRYKVAGANEALVVSGQRDRGPDGRRNLKVVRGGGVIVLPLIHKVGKLKLTARQINVNLADAVTRQGIKVAVQGVATFKIGADDESIRNAAERFLESQEEAVDSIVKNVLEGSLRSIVGTLTVEELNLDRQKFQQAVQDAAKGDLATSGLQIDSFTIQAIRDESGYMELIGQQETARRERDARMAKAAADQEAAVREAEAEQIKINAARDVSLRRAETETQTAAANARAAQAGPLAEAEATQEVTRKQTELAQLEADRKQQELVATTVRPAEAEAEAQIRRAEGAKGAVIAQAQADAERVKLAGEAQARVVEVTAEATAKQTTLEGNAEAGIVLSKGEAEAKALALRAEAYRQFNEAAIIQTVLSMLPEIVRAAAEPMANIDQLTVLSNDGASEMVKNVTRTVTEAGTTVKGLTGIDIPDLLGKAMGTARTDDEPPRAGGGGRRGPAGSGGGGRPSATGGGTDPAGTGPATGAAVAAPAGRPPRPTVPTSRPTETHRGPGLPATPAAPTPPRFDSPAAVDAAMADAARAVRAAATPPAPRTDTAAGPPRPAVAEITRQTTVDDAASRLASDLRAVPGIERFGAIRLAELERSGPRPLRTMWRIAREQLDERYGQLTIGELIDRYGQGRPPG
ncbi:MAG TPA: SPFH domain-containing protein [Candidatus Limnocylindrales bacterium]|nr:SPFH domain-containing protein [Candidatus Limnocylindrales bacterium]